MGFSATAIHAGNEPDAATGSREMAKRIPESVKLCTLAESFGGCREFNFASGDEYIIEDLDQALS
jgi:hypothetical protein